MSRRMTPGSSGRSMISQYLDTSSALAGPAGMAAMAAAERPASAPLAMSRRPKVAASSSAEAFTTWTPERAEAFTDEVCCTRRPWKAEARALLEAAVALTDAATRAAAEAAFTMEAISLLKEGGYGLRVRLRRRAYGSGVGARDRIWID